MNNCCCWCRTELKGVEGEGSQATICPNCIETENAGFIRAMLKHQAKARPDSQPTPQAEGLPQLT